MYSMTAIRATEKINCWETQRPSKQGVWSNLKAMYECLLDPKHTTSASTEKITHKDCRGNLSIGYAGWPWTSGRVDEPGEKRFKIVTGPPNRGADDSGMHGDITGMCMHVIIV